MKQLLPFHKLPKWDARFIELARHVAGWSKDPSTKVGAVIVGTRKNQVALGYNGFPPGIADDEDRLADREVKYRLTQHAERNVLDNSAFDVRGAMLYSTFLPCVECTKSLITRGVARVVAPGPCDREPWATDGAWTLDLLNEAGLSVTLYGS